MSNSITYRTVGGATVERPKPKVIFFDLWKTLATSYCREPVLTLQQILGHRKPDADDSAEELDPHFLRTCLTTDVRHPVAFVHHIAGRYERPVSPAHVEAFFQVIKAESGCTALFLDVFPTLERLSQCSDIRMGVISNLWPFPAEQIFSETGLGRYFPPETRVMSYEVGHQKPEPEIFRNGIARFPEILHPSECLMIGDNPDADVAGALALGMQAGLIDRTGTARAQLATDCPDAMYLQSLTDLFTEVQGLD